MSRRVKGGGSVYRRKDGRWEGAVYLSTTSGAARRIRVYGKTAKDASDKLTIRLADAERGVLVPERSWTVGDYMDYYLQEAAPKKLRPSTIELYKGIVRLYVKPLFDSQSLTHLTVTSLQRTMDEQLARGMSVSRATHVKTVLMSMLTNAMREDIVVRNVARLVSIGQYEPKSFRPWSVDEVRKFLSAVRSERLYAVFLMLALYGMREGEVLGLRWSDIDWDRGVIRLRQQLLYVRNELRTGPLKTKRSKRNLPLLAPVLRALIDYRNTAARLGIEPADDWDLVFRTETGQPLGARTFATIFHRLAKCAGLRRTRLHGFRHSAATILKNLGVPDKDIQTILGHARVAITQDFYEHADLATQQNGLTQLEHVLLNESDSTISRQDSPSNVISVDRVTTFQSVEKPMNGESARNIPYFALLASDPTLTPVIHHLRARTNTHIFGSLAVRFTVKNDHSDEPNPGLWQWISLRDALIPQPRRFIDRLSATAVNHTASTHSRQ
ncbi:tyrosine-type recombinase/integrase [Nocardia brasiliensis]|uniref:tyrosine-type recombinase/integrase n=1 Tax=Nocardia brasiliensis TaxID=37326 RepID=UPI003D94CCF8